MANKATGSCLCGAVTYEVDEDLGGVITCHCTDCQKWSGAGATHNIVVDTDKFAITKGEPKTYAKLADSGRTLVRYFCPDCGSPIFSRRKEMPEFTVLKAGTLDDKHGTKHVMDIWTASSTGWLPDDPDVAHHEGNRPAPTKT
jgi:hypothetical protein